MKKENLKLANEIQKKIIDLDDHKKGIINKIDRREKIEIRVIGESYNDTLALRPELSPVPFDVFIEAYYASIDAEIKNLEARFEML